MSERRQDINGFIEVKNNPISKVGVFPYLGKSIDPTGELGLISDQAYGVYRPEDELSNPNCIQSFKLVPWINEHEMIGDGGTPAEKKGIEGVIGEEVYFDTRDKMIKANLKIFSDSMKDLLNYGKEELSCGYRCEWQQEKGVFEGQSYDFVQRNIRGNHLALVDEGRMGKEVAVLDHKFTIDSNEVIQMDAKDKGAEDGGYTLDQAKKDISDIKAAIKDMSEAKKAKDMKDEEMEKEEKEKAKDAKDSLESEISLLKKQNATMQTALDSFEKEGIKTLMTQISARDALAKDLSEHVGVFDHSQMTELEVAKYGAEKLNIACDSGQELATLKGFLIGNKQVKTAVVAQDSKEPQAMTGLDEYINGGV